MLTTGYRAAGEEMASGESVSQQMRSGWMKESQDDTEPQTPWRQLYSEGDRRLRAF